MTARRGEAALAAASAGLFFLARAPLLFVRQPFFDELWTVWLARKPFGDILPALLLDSGPPLYYFLARIPNVLCLRALSLLFATCTLALLLKKKWYVAALLFAVYPPAVLHGVDARAYALCGLFVAFGVIALHEEKPGRGAVALVLAAYTHWYGALFLPLVLLSKSKRAWPIPLLFLPGLWLASQQPVAAMAWVDATSPLHALGVFSFVRPYAYMLFASPPVALCAIALVATVVALVRDRRLAPFVLVPVALTIAFALAGRNAYFPLRFESVLAVPLMLWLAASLAKWQRRERVVLLAVLVACGALSVAIGVLDHRNRPYNVHREGARALRMIAGDQRVLASGYLYLEALSLVKQVEPYPSEQGRHPGWASFAPTTEPLPPGPFLWIVDSSDPRLKMLGSRRAEVRFRNAGVLILRVLP